MLYGNTADIADETGIPRSTAPGSHSKFFMRAPKLRDDACSMIEQQRIGARIVKLGSIFLYGTCQAACPYGAIRSSDNFADASRRKPAGLISE
jgi:hypothetical protein